MSVIDDKGSSNIYTLLLFVPKIKMLNIEFLINNIIVYVLNLASFQKC
jgi:hypothetical protein